MTKLLPFIFFISAISVIPSWAHVSLAFPPARYPSLDFLDNARTKAPCGVLKPAFGKGNPTTLRSGSTFNVTWTLTYPHQGGFRIELLDDKDQPRYALTPETVTFIGAEDQTSQSYQVTLPSDFECQNCGIRLLRQAGEWGDYQFWSCADVQIVREPKDPCQGHGEWKEDQCRCDRLYSGEWCQSKDECWADQDCGVNGKCEELKTFSYPRRVCYCKQGWFGHNCTSPSPLQKSTLDISQHQSQEFGEDNNKIFWRILKDQNEIEIVLQYPSQTWIGIGWRPVNIAGSCGNLDKLSPATASVGSSGSARPPNPSAEPQPEPKPEPKPTAVDALPTLPNLPPQTTNDSLPSAPLFPQSASVTESEVSNGEVEEQNGGISATPTDSPSLGPVFSEATVDYWAETVPPWANHTIGSADILHATNVTTAETPFQGPFVTSVPGVAAGVEFTGSPVPFPPPYASGNASQPVRKAEGNESDVVGELCYGDWRYPVDCNDNCDIRISWTYVEETDEIEFSLESKTLQNTWTALGFSATGTMNDADMIVVKSLSSKLSVVDMFATGYAPPAKDPLQNVTVGPVTGTHLNGVLRTSFRRPRRSSDTNDVSFTDTDCYYFLLASGQLNSDGSMNKHVTPPHVSKKKVCIASCNPSPLGGTGEKYVTCDREFKFPPGCRPPSCDYVANWTYIAQTQEVIFQISSKEIGRWTGIGFSREGNMTNSDIIMGWVYENGTFVTDRFAYGRQQPAIDKQQDIRDVHGRIEDDIQTLTFSRKMVTNDPEDISLKECLYYLFPVGGGRVLARTSRDFQDKATPLGFHDQTLPKISRDLICICNDDGIPVNITTSRLRRQAVSSEVEPQGKGRRPSSLPQGQSAVNITLGAQPIPIFDPTTFEESLLTATPSSPPPSATPTASEESSPAASTAVPTTAPNANQAPAEETTTESLLHLQSAIVAIKSSITISPVLVENSSSPSSNTELISASPSSQPPVPEPEPTANTTISSDQRSSPTSIPELNPQLASNPESEPKAIPEPKPKAEPSPEPRPQGEPKPEPEPKSNGEAGQSSESSSLHPMDCTDMVVGSAVGLYGRVADYYSISRSTPKLDDYFGGSQSLTAAMAYEEHGVTTLAFRRLLTSIDAYDHNITVDSPMVIIWAKGQEHGKYSHNEPSGLEQGKASVKEFYSPDVLAYHGNKNRGSFTLNFGAKKQASPNAGSATSAPSSGTSGSTGSCSQHFLYPAGCHGEACDYNVTWMKNGGDVEFWLEADSGNNHWTGIGFSKDGLMAKSDLVIVTTDTVGPPEVTDRFVSGYEMPTEDKKQNIFNIDASYINGRLKAQFSRPLATDDAEEDVDLNECMYFLYPYNGGPIADHRVQKHSATPLKSTEPICLSKCKDTPGKETAGTKEDGTSRTPPVAKKPPELATAAPIVDQGRKFSVIVRILNEQWNEALSNSNSAEHQALAAKTVKVMDTLLRSKFAGFDKARVLRFIQGSVIAEIEVIAAGLNSVQLQEAIIPQISAGAVEGLQIDPEYVRVKEIQVGLTPEEIRNYIIIGVACFLVMVATGFAVCLIVRTRRRRSKEMKSNWNLVPFTPYAYLMPPSGVYPVAYQYPTLGPAPGFDHKKQAIYQEGPVSLSATPAYSADYSATGSRQLGATHHRQYSNATTATPVNAKTPSPGSENQGPAGGRPNIAPSKNGNGETSYAEWAHRVGAGGQPQQPARGQPTGTPYVQYPNDPYNFYTMNGSQRSTPFLQSVPPRPIPPPGYYRPY